MKSRNSQLIEMNGAGLRAVVGGKGHLVILPHGITQLDPLVEAGFQVIAPARLRSSDCPAEIEDYNIIELTNDVVVGGRAGP